MNTSLNSSGPAIFDADGFLLDPAMWSESLADRIAQTDGLGGLNEQQIDLLHTLRHEYAKHGTVTALSHVCHLTGKARTACSTCSPAPARPGEWPGCRIRARKPRHICKPFDNATMGG